MYKKFHKLYPRWIPTRVLICMMTFTACWTSYMCRLQMPILAVPMITTGLVNITTSSSKGGYCTQQQEQEQQQQQRQLLEELRLPRALKFLDPGAYLEHYILEERLLASASTLLPRDVEGEMGERGKEEGVSKQEFRYPRQEGGGDVTDGSEVESESSMRKSRPDDAPITLVNGLPFAWSTRIRGQLIASYSYGNVPGNFLGGVMALKWGPKKAILWSSVVAAIISLISPILAQLHWGLLLFSRIIIGLTGGVTFPACHTLVAKWAPPEERARFVWSLLGGTFGTILTYPMVAAIADTLLWEQAWYIPSILMIVWILFFAVLTYDSPEEHPGITAEEKEYILTAQAGIVKSAKPTLKQTPLVKIFTSVPFISLVCCHFGNLFLLFFYQNSMMLYLTKALGFQLTKGGAVAALPWAGRMFFGFIFSWIGDIIKRKDLLTTTIFRKIAMVFSHLVPGVFLIAVGYAGCNLLVANIFLFLALGFNGAASISNLSNNQDLSPNFAGFLYGIMNTVGCTAGIIISPLVEEIAGKHGHPIERWQTLFWIGAAVCIGSMAIFLFGGSGEIQSWNEVKTEEDATGRN